jgi:hypothetical protein
MAPDFVGKYYSILALEWAIASIDIGLVHT